MLIRIPLAIVEHRTKSVRDLLARALLAITAALFTAFSRGGKSKIYAEELHTANYAGREDAIGNGLETVCGAGQMRRDKLRVGNERLFTFCLTPFSSA